MLRCQSRTKSDTNRGADAFGTSDRHVADPAKDGNACSADADCGLPAAFGIPAAAPKSPRPMVRVRSIIAGGLALAGMLSVAHGAWIPTKAKFAQVLLEDA